MKKFSLLFAVVCMATFAFAQVQIIVQNGAKTETYTDLDEAVKAAVVGDTIYLPGKSFAQANTTIDKKLHWVGTGHYPAATGATGITRLNGTYYFTGTTDGSSFEGIYFTAGVHLGNSDGSDEATDMLFKRCRIGGYFYLRRATSGNPKLNTTITECVVDNYLHGNNGSNCLVEKSIIKNSRAFHQSLFKHCIFFYYDTLTYSTSCIIENSVILSNYYFLYKSNTIHLKNCLFAFNVGFPYDTYTGENNIVNVGAANIFAATPNSISTFSYNNDYHLKAGSAGIGAATDGTNIGVYGSTLPYKANAVPFYPHITKTAVAANADPDTKTLKVEFTVEGQKR